MLAIGGWCLYQDKFVPRQIESDRPYGKGDKPDGKGRQSKASTTSINLTWKLPLCI